MVPGFWLKEEDFKNDAVFGGKLDRARLHDLRAERRELEHLVVGNFLELLCVFHHARVGSVNAVDVGVDFALVGFDRGSERDGG